MQSSVSDVRNCICLDARRTARHLTHVYDEALRPSGLKVTQFQLLAAIGEAEPATQQKLTELLGMDRTTLTRNLGLLERDVFIDIEVGTNDRRERIHRLTPVGRRALAEAMPLWRKVHKRLLQYLEVGKNGATLVELEHVFARLADFHLR